MGRGAGVSRTNRPGRFSPVASRVALGLGCIAVLIFPVSWERLPDFRPVHGRVADPRKPFSGIDPTTDPRTHGPIGPTTTSTSTTTTVPGQPAPPTTTTTVPPVGQFAYLSDFGSKPPYVSTCKPVKFVIRKAGGPPNGDQLVLEAIQRLSDVTGLKFEWKGFTDAVWQWNQRRTIYSWEDQQEPLLIGWATVAEAPDFGNKPEYGGGAVGLGGPLTSKRPDGQVAIIGGAAMLRSGAPEVAAFGSGQTMGNVLLHELGHAFGLDHVNAVTEQMNPVNTDEAPDGYGPGDLKGLQGITKAC